MSVIALLPECIVSLVIDTIILSDVILVSMKGPMRCVVGKIEKKRFIRTGSLTKPFERPIREGVGGIETPVRKVILYDFIVERPVIIGAPTGDRLVLTRDAAIGIPEIRMRIDLFMSSVGRLRSFCFSICFVFEV